MESGGLYNDRLLTLDMRDLGEPCGKHNVAGCCTRRACAPRWAMGVGLGRAWASWVVAPNHLQRQITVDGPGQS